METVCKMAETGRKSSNIEILPRTIWNVEWNKACGHALFIRSGLPMSEGSMKLS